MKTKLMIISTEEAVREGDLCGEHNEACPHMEFNGCCGLFGMVRLRQFGLRRVRADACVAAEQLMRQAVA